MTSVTFDVQSGRLQLDRPSFDVLVDWATHRRADDAGPFRGAGVIDARGALDPRVRASVDAVVHPVCRLTLRVEEAKGQRSSHQAWISTAVASFLLPMANELFEFVSMHPSFVPEAVARLAALGPRPRSDGSARSPVVLDPAALDDMTGPNAELRSKAARRLLLAASGSAPRGKGTQPDVQAVDGGILRRWEAIMTWDPAHDSRGRRAMHVIDTPVGMWLLEPARDRLLASPVTPTAVWRLLVGLLPHDRELHARHRPGFGEGLDLGPS